MECRQLHNSAQEDAKALRSLELCAASEAEASRLILSLSKPFDTAVARNLTLRLGE